MTRKQIDKMRSFNKCEIQIINIFPLDFILYDTLSYHKLVETIIRIPSSERKKIFGEWILEEDYPADSLIEVGGILIEAEYYFYDYKKIYVYADNYDAAICKLISQVTIKTKRGY